MHKCQYIVDKNLHNVTKLFCGVGNLIPLSGMVLRPLSLSSPSYYNVRYPCPTTFTISQCPLPLYHDVNHLGNFYFSHFSNVRYPCSTMSAILAISTTPYTTMSAISAIFTSAILAISAVYTMSLGNKRGYGFPHTP